MQCFLPIIHVISLTYNQDEVFTVFSKVALSPKEACGILLGPLCGDGYNPWMQNWTVTVPENKPPITPVPPPKVAKKTFLLISSSSCAVCWQSLSNACIPNIDVMSHKPITVCMGVVVLYDYTLYSILCFFKAGR